MRLIYKIDIAIDYRLLDGNIVKVVDIKLE